jgi:hypothetical protein
MTRFSNLRNRQGSSLLLGQGHAAGSLSITRAAACIVGPVAFAFEVGPVTGRGRFEAPLFHFDPGKLGLHRLDPVIQGVTIACAGWHRFVLEVVEIDGDTRLSIVPLHARQPQATHQ